MPNKSKSAVKRGKEPVVLDFANRPSNTPETPEHLRALREPFPSFVRNGPFRFFDLPAELWEMVLKHALDDGSEQKITLKSHEPAPTTNSERDNTVHHEQSTPTALVRRRPRTDTLLANKRLNAEYARAAEGSMMLILKDTAWYSFTGFNLPSPSLYLVRELEIRLFLFCVCWTPSSIHHQNAHGCRAAREIGLHKEWIKAFTLRLPRLKTLTIDFNIAYCHSHCVSKAHTHPCVPFVKEAIPSVHDLAHLKKYSLAWVDGYCHAKLDGPKKLLMTCRKDTDGSWVTETPPQNPGSPIKRQADTTGGDSEAAEGDGSTDEGESTGESAGERGSN